MFGSFISIFLTPILRVYVGYWIAFGTPAILLLTAVAIFFSGRSSYIMVPVGDNPIGIFCRVLKDGIVALFKRGKAPVKHWLDRAEPFHGKENIENAKAVLRILVVFIPLPCFWALFDQHSSRWIEQAREMNRQFGSIQIEPDQVPTLNPLFVIILIPLFDRILFPFLRRKGLNITSLRKMTLGMILTSIAFAVAGFVQMVLDRGQISVAWQTFQFLILTVGELLVSVSGLEFAYTQAPASMKSVMTAIWLLTVSAGNAIVVVIAELQLFDLAIEFFFYSGLMLVFTILFFFLVRTYKYVDHKDDDAESHRINSSEKDSLLPQT